MNCSKVLDLFYENEEVNEDSMPLFIQIQIWLHTFLCQDCARKIERFETTRNIMRNDFLPPSPNLEDSIMAKISSEEQETSVPHAIPAGLSTRGWIIAGLVILISLITVFLGLDFKEIAQEMGISFLLPVGITIGIVLTSYGAFFIGSHLKEFSERFGL